MKKLFFVGLFLAVNIVASAQSGGVLGKIKKNVEGKINQTVNPGTKDNSGTGNAGSNADQNDVPQENLPAQKQNDSPQDINKSIKAYSKYDFVPGEKVIGYEDFSTGNIGDFPAGWNTNASGEIVTIEGKSSRWLWITKPGVFVPEFTEEYPEDFTFEFDLLHGVPMDGGNLTISLVELENISQPQYYAVGTNRATFDLVTANTGSTTGMSRFNFRKDGVSEAGNQVYTELLNDNQNPVHISIWRQKERVRLYVNQEKLWDIPKALAKEAKLNAIVFYANYAEESVKQFLGNLRLAIGAPDTRNKILTQNKWVTHGILFDVNSASIKPESYGTLKEMANVLKEYADLKVKIIGHTDADGSDTANLELSKIRAESVKEALANEFFIDGSRMETDGKGESEPIDKNDTPAGKANNRRVEFVKI